MVRTKSLCSTVGVLLLMVVCLSVCSATRHALFVSTEMKDPEDALGSGNDADLGDSDSIEEKKLMDRLRLARRRNNNTKTDLEVRRLYLFTAKDTQLDLSPSNWSGRPSMRDSFRFLATRTRWDPRLPAKSACFLPAQNTVVELGSRVCHLLLLWPLP